MKLISLTHECLDTEPTMSEDITSVLQLKWWKENTSGGQSYNKLLKGKALRKNKGYKYMFKYFIYVCLLKCKNERCLVYIESQSSR